MRGNTNWNLYKTFVTVFEMKNMSHASQALGISRVAVGKNIRELGNQLGVILFTPCKRGVVPTAEAISMYPQIKKVTEIIAETENNLNALNNDSTGTIKMVVHGWFAKHYLDKYLIVFYKKYPKIQIQFFQDEGLYMLKNKKIDFFIDFDILFQGVDIKTKRVLSETFYDNFVASKSFLDKHNLTKDMTKEDLSRLPIIARPEAWQEYKKQFTEPVTTIINVPTVDVVYQYVKKDMGVGVFGRTQQKEVNDSNIVELKIQDFEYLTSTVSCFYENLSRHAKTFIDGLIEFCKE